MSEDEPQRTEGLETLLLQLQDERDEERAAAVQLLGSSDDSRVVTALIGALRHDASELVRIWAAHALGKIADVAAIPALLAALTDDPSVAARAADALGIMGKSAVEALIDALQAEDARIRYWAAFALRWTPADEAVPALIGALADRHSTVRRNAAQTLGYLVDRRAAESLIHRLNDPDWEVRDATAAALGRLADSGVTTTEQVGCITAMLIGQLSNPEWQVRLSAAQALWRFHDQAAIRPLILALADPVNAMRISAAEALGAVGAPEAIDPLMDALRSQETSKDLGQVIAATLARIGPPTIPILLHALADPDPDVRYWAATALGYLGAEQALPALAALEADAGLTRTRAKVRTAATRAIKQIQGKRPIS